MVLNTTSGPVEVPKGSREHVVNTSRVVEEDLVNTDEGPEILAVLPAAGWCAVIAEDAVPLVAFVALDSGRMYGVPIGEDGRVDLVDGDVEKHEGFVRYEQASNDKEKK